MLSAVFVGGAARVCLEAGAFGICPQLRAGALWVDAARGLEQLESIRTAHVVAGARLFAATPMLFGAFALRFYLELGAALTLNRFLVDTRVIWQTAPVAGALGVLLTWNSQL